MNKSFFLYLLYIVAAGNSATCILTSVEPMRFLLQEFFPKESGFEVQALVPPDTEPEKWQMIPSQRKLLKKDCHYFSVGFPFEERIESLAQENDFYFHEFISLEKENHEHEHHHHGAQDPHLWLSPSSIQREILPVLQEWQNKFAAQSFKQQWVQLEKVGVEKLEQAKHEYRTLLVNKPKAILFFHPSHDRFCKEFELNCLSVEHEGKLPSGRSLTKLSAEIKKMNIVDLWVSPQQNSLQVKKFAQEHALTVRIVNPLAADSKMALIEFLKEISK